MYEMQKQGGAAAPARVEGDEGQLLLLTWPDNKVRALDVSLGAGLGYGRPLALRKLVRRLVEAGELGDVVSRPSPSAADPGGREFWLT